MRAFSTEYVLCCIKVQLAFVVNHYCIVLTIDRSKETAAKLIPAFIAKKGDLTKFLWVLCFPVKSLSF